MFNRGGAKSGRDLNCQSAVTSLKTSGAAIESLIANNANAGT